LRSLIGPPSATHMRTHIVKLSGFLILFKEKLKKDIIPEGIDGAPIPEGNHNTREGERDICFFPNVKSELFTASLSGKKL